MPKAFCGLEMCAKNLRELCALCERKNVLCERKNSPRQFSNVLFLTEKHRRTEHTVFHRDIKSTDFTEPYSQQNTHSQPRSFQEPALLVSRTRPSPFENMPFLMLGKALLQRSLQPADFMHVTYTEEAYILNGNIMLVDRMT